MGGEPERPPAVPGAVRASDRERDMAVEVLGQHAATGRLTLGELEERISTAFAAKTRAELDELTGDLPESRQEPHRAGRPGGRRASRPHSRRHFKRLASVDG